MPPGRARRDGLLPRLRAPDRLEDEVVLAEHLGRARAEGLGLRAALGMAVADHDVAPVEHEQPREHEPDRPAAEHGDIGRVGAACHRVHAGGQRLGHGRPGEVQAAGDRVQRGRRRGDALGEAAEHPGRSAADRRAPRAARAAGAAGHRVADEDALARVGAHAGGLVAEARRILAQDPVAVAQHLAIGPAGGGGPDLHEHLAGRLGHLLDAQVVGAVEDRRAHYAIAGALQGGAHARDPPPELLARPAALGRVGVDDRAVAEDPAVELQAGDEPEVEVALAHGAALGGQEVLEQLVVRGLRAPGVVAQVPRDLQRGRALAGDVPVEHDDAPVGEAEVLVAQVAVDERRAAGGQRPGQRRRIAQVGEHGLRDVVVGRLGERLPGDRELLGDHVAAVALGGGHGRRADRQVALERDPGVDGLAAEGRVQRRGRGHHLAMARAADRAVGGHEGGRPGRA